jgi:hypothetical protein
MNFKEFFESSLNNFEIIDSYFNKKEPVRNLCKSTGKSIGKIYRIIHSFGCPNRNKNHYFIKNLIDNGLENKNIARLTGYSERQIRNIKNGHNN